MQLPEPLQLPWSLKRVTSAESKVEILPDGRLKLWIRHEVLNGVTPQMLVWWFQNIDGEMDVDGRRLPRYRVWHPRDHIQHQYVKRCADGSVGAGTIMRITEAFDRNPKYLIDSLTLIEKLDESGFVHCPLRHGMKIAKMEYCFKATPTGTLYENSLVVGPERAPRLAKRLINSLAFSKEKGIAWIKHNVEEVGSFENFLPELYSSSTRN